MNLDLVKDPDFHDAHAYTLSKLTALYRVDMSGTGNLSDIGYQGFPDPIFEDDSIGTYTPDFLAVGKDGDAQIIDVKGFENIERHLETRNRVEEKIESTVEDLGRYEDITTAMVADYLDLHDIDFEPAYHELVVLLPQDIYSEYSTAVVNGAESAGLTVWVLEDSGAEYLWLANGEHDNQELNKGIERGSGRGLQVPSSGKDLIPFARDTDRDIVRFRFVANLMAYCAHEGKQKFTFKEIDDILVNEQKPRMFAHLPREEREGIWIDGIHAMIDRFGIISQLPAVEETYEWEKTRFLSQPRDRFKILQDIGEDLGVFEVAQ